MAGSSFGKNFVVTTWGESHGKAIGAVIDGCPAGIELSEEDIQKYLDRRKPGQSDMTTARKEDDKAEILSGVFEGKTTGTPISVMIRNSDQHSADYSNIKDVYRPGHADYTFQKKYGLRDYRGGGRSSGRETVGRVMGGAVAAKILSSLGIKATAYTLSVGDIKAENIDLSMINENPLFMPDNEAAKRAEEYIRECRENNDSVGGVIECRITGMPVGIGETVFDKLDANLAKAMLSIGSVKGFEIGSGFEAAKKNGSENNDPFYADEDGNINKKTNNAGGVLGGMSDGSDIVFRIAVKPTPSIAREQKTVEESYGPDGKPAKKAEDSKIEIKGRHDPVIMPRAVVVAESMAMITIADLLLSGMSSRIDSLVERYTE